MSRDSSIESVQLQQCLLGIQCDHFVMIAADQINTQGVIVTKDDEEKIFQASDGLLMGVNGDNGDATQLTQFLAKHLQLYKLRNGYQLGTAAVAHFTRRYLADRLRGGGTDSMVNLLLGGFDAEGGQLYHMDYFVSCLKVPFAAHGIGGMLGVGILDKHYKPTLTEQQGYDLMQTAVHEVQKRLSVSLPKFQVSVVDKDGVRRLPTICALPSQGSVHLPL